LFNCFYQELIHRLDALNCGICINGNKYNTLCYADDVLLLSLTQSGLQQLINTANDYIVDHGLKFNATKTVCSAFSRRHYADVNVNLDGVRLQVAPSITYLGVQMANDAKTHVDSRASACRKAFFALQSAGLHPRGLQPRAMAYLWSAAIRPVLLCHCVATKPSARRTSTDCSTYRDN
jgi:hypothetical protein